MQTADLDGGDGDAGLGAPPLAQQADVLLEQGRSPGTRPRTRPPAPTCPPAPGREPVLRRQPQDARQQYLQGHKASAVSHCPWLSQLCLGATRPLAYYPPALHQLEAYHSAGVRVLAV